MHSKNIRRMVTKQLKKKVPRWARMTRKSKKELTQKIMSELEHNYDYSQSLDVTIEELIGIESQQPSGGIRSLSEMAAYLGPAGTFVRKGTVSIMTFLGIVPKYEFCLNQNIINIQLFIEKPLLNSEINFASQAPN